MKRALVRPPSSAYSNCIREAPDARIDVGHALAQHRAYVHALESCGLDVIALPPEPDLPDACFVEDTAVIVDGRAIITRPGAPARRSETDSVARELAKHLPVIRMERGRLDGGDVIVTAHAIFAGLSNRTDAEGVAELQRLAARPVRVVEIRGLLHLKTGATPIGDGVMLRRRGAFPGDAFPGFEGVDTDEPHGSTVLVAGGHAVVSNAAPRTAEMLARRGLTVHAVDIAQFNLGDAGVTCLSIGW